MGVSAEAEDAPSPTSAVKPMVKERLPLSVRMGRIEASTIQIAAGLQRGRGDIEEVIERRKDKARQFKAQLTSSFLLPWNDFNLEAMSELGPTVPGSRCASSRGLRSRGASNDAAWVSAADAQPPAEVSSGATP